MTVGTLDDGYFEWLYRQIGSVRNRNPERSYWQLAKQLYTTSFSWSVPNDDNRCEDGLELRHEWIEDNNIEDADRSWLLLDCSFLEMLIALSRRLAFESEGEPGEWFWKLMQNLDFRGYTDAVWSTSIERQVSRTLERVVYRKYEPDGAGGLFPLRHPRRDQRQVELWYQMAQYVLEGDYLEHGPLV